MAEPELPGPSGPARRDILALALSSGLLAGLARVSSVRAGNPTNSFTKRR